MKNSIEEDIKNAEHFINSIKTDKEYKEENGWHGYYNKEIVELARMLEHILSDYKRVLKENEILKEEKEQAWEEWNNLERGSYETKQKLKQQIKELQKENEEWDRKFCNLQNLYFKLQDESELKRKEYQETYKDVREELKELKKENEELKSDNLEYQRIQDIFDKRTYRKKYLEERRKEEPNLLYPDSDEIYRRYYELKKENQQLRNEYINIRQDAYIQGRAEEQKKAKQIIYKNYIPVQKIEKLIEELKQDDINMTKKYKEKKNITGELLGIDKVRVRAYREKTREINEKLHKLLIETIETKGE